MRKLRWLGLLAAVAIALPAIAATGVGYTLFGNATYISPGNASNRAVQLVSNATTGVYSGIDFAVPPSLTLNDLNDLSTDFNFTAGGCGLGSPRFVVELGGTANCHINVYIGPPPNYNTCTPGWQNTGQLLQSTSLVDDQNCQGGTFYDAYSSVQARLGTQPITDIFLVSDAGSGPQFSATVDIDNTSVDGILYTYEPSSKDDCKNGGWQNFTFSPGPFKNQGQCVSYFAKQQH